MPIGIRCALTLYPIGDPTPYMLRPTSTIETGLVAAGGRKQNTPSLSSLHCLTPIAIETTSPKISVICWTLNFSCNVKRWQRKHQKAGESLTVRLPPAFWCFNTLIRYNVTFTCTCIFRKMFQFDFFWY